MFTLKIIGEKRLLLIVPTELEAVAITLKNKYPEIFDLVYEADEEPG